MDEMIPTEIIQREQEAEYLSEIRRLDDLAFCLLSAAEGDVNQAERFLDDFVDLICEGGVLSTWRLRILLAKVREGL